MIHIKVQYDAYNRTFTLVDRDLGTLLENYAIYDLAVPFTFDEAGEPDTFSSREMSIAHA